MNGCQQSLWCIKLETHDIWNFKPKISPIFHWPGKERFLINCVRVLNVRKVNWQNYLSKKKSTKSKLISYFFFSRIYFSKNQKPLFWTKRNTNLKPVQNILDMNQNANFTLKGCFLVQSKIIWGSKHFKNNLDRPITILDEKKSFKTGPNI